MSKPVKCLIGGILGAYAGLHVVVLLLYVVSNTIVPGIKDPGASGWDPLSVTIGVLFTFLGGAIVGTFLGVLAALRWI